MAQSEMDRFRVVVLDDYEGLAPEVPSFATLKGRADLSVMRARLTTENELKGVLEGVHAIVLVRERTHFGDKEFSLAPSLRLVSQTGGGIAHLDLQAATRRGVGVAVTPGGASMSTVELTWGLILSVFRRISEIDRAMHQGAWPIIVGRVLEGKTIGIVGLGKIGREVARIAAAFRAKVLATGRTLTEQRARDFGAVQVSLDQLLQQSDVVTVHVGLRPETRGLIGEREIALMKPGSVLVNTSRGPIVSQSALMRGLETGRLAGAGLDVYDDEPLATEHPLRHFDNVVLSSHRGYAAVESLCERYESAFRNILSFMDGNPTNLLNPEALTPS